MKIKDILFIIKKRCVILILFPVIAGLVTAYYNFFMLTDMYQSKITFIVARDATAASGETITPSELSLWQSLVGDFTQILQSNSCINNTAKALSKKYDNIYVNPGLIMVDASQSSRVMTVIVSDTDPYRACDIANELVKQFSNLVDVKLNMKYVVVIDEAKADTNPVFPNRMQNIIIAVVAGLLAGGALCFLLELTDMSLKTNEDVEKHLGLPVLSRIPRYY